MVKVLDHGFIRLVETWGHGDAGAGVQEVYTGWNKTPDMECGIVEAARQSTQACFRGWEDIPCLTCGRSVSEGGTAHIGCTTCGGKGYLPGDARLLKHLYTHRPPHATPFEFAGAVIEVRAPIFVFREWHRHRTQSYNEMSARYAPLPDMNYEPGVERCFLVSATNKQAAALAGSSELTHEAALDWLEDLHMCYENCERVYAKGLRIGIPKEVARLPVSVGRYSQMRASANLRNWLAFMTLRADPDAQWEIRQYAIALGDILAAKFPRTWALWAA